MVLTVSVNHLPFPYISTSLGCSEDEIPLMCTSLTRKSWIHGVFWAQSTRSVDHSACKVAVLKWGGLCLFGLQMSSGVFLGWVRRGDGEGCACFAFGGVHAAFAVSWNVLIREHLRYFLAGATCLPLERPKRHQKAFIFKAFLGKDITILLCFLPYSSQSLHPTKTNRQTDWQVVYIQHLAKLDQFAKCRWLFS